MPRELLKRCTSEDIAELEAYFMIEEERRKQEDAEREAQRRVDELLRK